MDVLEAITLRSSSLERHWSEDHLTLKDATTDPLGILQERKTEVLAPFMTMDILGLPGTILYRKIKRVSIIRIALPKPISVVTLLLGKWFDVAAIDRVKFCPFWRPASV